MKQLTLNISDNKYQTFLEFRKTLDYMEVPETDKKYPGNKWLNQDNNV